MNAETLMIFLLCVYIPIGLVMAFFGFVQVLGWINEATNNLANYHANIDGQIASLVTPPVSPSLTAIPWSQ